jgi:hypothetical protein
MPARWVLAYPGSSKGGLGTIYTVDDFVHLIAVVDSSGRPTRWLSTGMIFLQLYAPSGRTFTTWIGGQAATGADWREYLDSLLAPTGAFTRLDSAVSMVARAVQPLGSAFAVALMIPYPEPRAGTLRFDGVTYDLRSTAGRVAAVAAYVQAVRADFASAQYSHLRLDGYYWLSESVGAPDTATVIAVARAIHRDGLRLLWVPYYFAAGLADWRQLGFDEAWLQPNWFFNRQISPLRVDSAAHRALALGLGVELEFNAKIYSDSDYYDRFGPYLAMLERNPRLRERSVALYEGHGALIHLSRSDLPRDRAIYARLVQVLTQSDTTAPR